MNIFSLPPIIAFTINFSIALIILLDKNSNPLNRWFSAFVFNFAIWNFAEVLLLNSKDVETALFAAQILYRSIFLSPALFLMIAYQFPKNFHSYSQHIRFPFLIFALPIMLLIVSFPHFQIRLVPISGTQNIYYYQISFSPSLPFILLLVTFVGYTVWGSLVLTYKIPHLRTSRQKNQTRFLLTGILFIFIALIIINALRPYFPGEFIFYTLSSILLISTSIFFLLAIVQYHFFKISRIISGGITYTIISSIILAVYFLIVKSLSESLIHYLGFNSFAFQALLILLLIMVIHPLEGRIQIAVDYLLYRDIHVYRKHFMKFSRGMLHYLEMDVFFNKVKEFLKKEFQISAVYIFLKEEDSGNFISFERNSSFPFIPASDALITHLASTQTATELSDSLVDKTDSPVQQFLKSRKIQLLIPMILEGEIIGIIMLPQRHLQREYPEEIQEILTIFGNEITTVFHRNRIIEAIRREERKRTRLQHLAALGQLTAGVAHEIRNPLNTISTAAETILKKKLPPEDEQELKTYILEEVTRLNNILSDFLSLSRLREPTREPVDIEALIDKVILNVENRTTITLQIEKHISTQLPPLESDAGLLYQALLNLGINAVEAIEVRCQQDTQFDCNQGIIRFDVSYHKQQFLIRISDNGIGIPPELKDNIWEPFFTTKDKGTGLGLSITHNIVQSLNGELHVQSRPGNTIFIIQLPQSIQE